MAIATESIVEIVTRYIEEVEKSGIKISEAIIFGKPMTFKTMNEKVTKKGIVEVTRQIMEQIEALSLFS